MVTRAVTATVKTPGGTVTDRHGGNLLARRCTEFASERRLRASESGFSGPSSTCQRLELHLHRASSTRIRTRSGGRSRCLASLAAAGPPRPPPHTETATDVHIPCIGMWPRTYTGTFHDRLRRPRTYTFHDRLSRCSDGHRRTRATVTCSPGRRHRDPARGVQEVLPTPQRRRHPIEREGGRGGLVQGLALGS